MKDDKHKSDFYGWLLEQYEHLSAGRVESLDLDGLAEEISTLLMCEEDEFGQSMVKFLQSVIEYQYQHWLSASDEWEKKVNEERFAVLDYLKHHPDLKSHVDEEGYVADRWEQARRRASEKAGRKIEFFDTPCPEIYQALFDGWLPECVKRPASLA